MAPKKLPLPEIATFFVATSGNCHLFCCHFRKLPKSGTFFVATSGNCPKVTLSGSGTRWTHSFKSNVWHIPECVTRMRFESDLKECEPNCYRSEHPEHQNTSHQPPNHQPTTMSIINIPTQFHQDPTMFNDKCVRENVVFVTEHVPKKYAKGAVSPYKLCGKLCKKYNLDLKHLKVLWKSVSSFRDYNRPVNTFWELLHDQIEFLHGDKSWVCVDQSNVLDQLRQKIPLRHISRLVGDFLIPKDCHKQFYDPTPGQINAARRIIVDGCWGMEDVPSPQKFQGMGVCVTGYWLGVPCPRTCPKPWNISKFIFGTHESEKPQKWFLTSSRPQISTLWAKSSRPAWIPSQASYKFTNYIKNKKKYIKKPPYPRGFFLAFILDVSHGLYIQLFSNCR